MTEDEMVGWHHRLNEHEFEHALEDGEGQGSLVCCSPLGSKESDTTERLNNNNDLLFSTWNSTQCYVAAWMGGEFGKEWICVYEWLSPFHLTDVTVHSFYSSLPSLPSLPYQACSERVG